VITKEYISKKAADYGFSAAYCCAPQEADGVPACVKSLVLLLRAYQPHDGLVDAFYTANQAAYCAAGKMILEIAYEHRIETHLLNNCPLKPIATHRAGLARGMNTLNYHPEFGSKFCMALIGLDEEIVGESRCEDEARLSCAACNWCAKVCPGGAITTDGFVKENCIRFYMINGKPMPGHLRPLIGSVGGSYAVIGCDVCQRVCPANRAAESLRRPEADAPFTLEELLCCTPETLERFAALYGRNYANRNRIIAQALLAAGNSGDEKYLPYIQAYMSSPSATVQEHAVWAAERINFLQNNY